MSSLTPAQIGQLLQPYFVGSGSEPSLELCGQLAVYLDLLLRWNGRTNLTAIREPEEIVRRHFGESLFAGLQLQKLCAANASLLDFGSGAGFPGLPIQLLVPGLQVTLAESQNKKASFLRECVRTFGLRLEIWADRVEVLHPTKRFDVVTLRAVDRMEAALLAARERVAPGGLLASLASTSPGAAATQLPLPGSDTASLFLLRIA